MAIEERKEKRVMTMHCLERNYEYMKPVVEMMGERYSCRNFSDQKIPDEVMDTIIQVALGAASGGNLQPVSVIAVKDEARKKELCRLCEDQKFIEEAAVNLVFCMDWHKYDVYTQYKKAPFIANRSFGHFMIAMEDVMCMAQTVETAGFLCGIGSCYVGSVCNFISEVSDFLKLPDKVFPVVMLSMGYPKMQPKKRIAKLKRDMIFCEEAYTAYTPEQIAQSFDEKYAGRSLSVPKNEEAANRMFDTFYACLLTTYTKEQADEILQEVKEKGKFDETQRRFGLHYDAVGMLMVGKDMQNDLIARKMDIFAQK